MLIQKICELLDRVKKFIVSYFQEGHHSSWYPVLILVSLFISPLLYLFLVHNSSLKYNSVAF